MVVLVFQTNVARADTPGPGEWTNVATGGTASASSTKSGYAASKAIDADPASYWKSAKTTGWVAVRFTGMFPVSEVHITLVGNAFPSLELYMDTDNNGAYGAAERVLSTSTNSALVVKVLRNGEKAAGVMLNFPVAMGGSKVPQVGDLAVFSKADTDKDGLPNDFERSTVYYSMVSATEVPVAVTDPGSASAYVQMNALRGVPFRGMAEFVVNQSTYTQVSASIGYKSGTTWVDIPAWDPGVRLTKPTITSPVSGSWFGSSVTISATVPAPSLVARMDFYIDAETTPKGSVAAPTGGVYSWTWSTGGYADGSHTVKARAVDIWGGQTDASVVVYVDRTAPIVTITAPANGGTVPGVVATVSWTVAESGTGIASVLARLDSGAWITVTGTTSHQFSVSLATHTVTVVATDRAGLQGSASVTFTAIKDMSPPTVSITGLTSACPYEPVILTGTATDTMGLYSVTFLSTTRYLNGATSWSGETEVGGYPAGTTYTYSISAVDTDGQTASASKTVGWRNLKMCQFQAPSPLGSLTGSDPTPASDGLALDTGGSSASATTASALVVGSPAASWGVGRWAVEAGYTPPSPGYPPQHTVRVNLTQSLSSMTSAERTARIAPLALSSELLNSVQSWRVTITDWVAGSSTVITSFSLRVEEMSSTTLTDTDGDGLSDYVEVATYSTLPVAQDTDFDGLTDWFEKDPQLLAITVNGVTTTVSVKTSPTNPDTDGDTLADGEERILGVDRVVTNPGNPDTDQDGLWDGYTINGHKGELSYGANATRTDTDGDTLSDSFEANPQSLTLTVNGVSVTRSVTTLPYATDSDGDGLKDNQEWAGTTIYGVKTDPSSSDTDSDSLADGQERYMKEVAMPTRKTVGTYLSVPLSVRIGGAVDKVTVSYGLSGIDMSYFYVILTQGSNTVYLRTYQGSGLFNFSSADLPSSMWSGGTYTLSVWSAATGGVLERYSILFTIRTSPVRADTDGDGLSDAEETTYGQDAWITDPNLPDTDGDTWSDGYEISRATSPISVDTDGDGAWDSVDVDPLRDLVVRVTVNKIHHGGSPWCTPELVGVVRVNDAYTWVTQHLQATQDSFTSWLCPPPIPTNQLSTASFYMSYYADVPDDVSTFNLRMTGWAINPGRGDDILVDQSLTYALNTWYPTQTLWNGNSWFSFDVATVGLEKSKTLLITDGQVTVRSSSGTTRMVAPDRFFVFSLSLSSAYYPFSPGINTIVVPRSIFLDTKLKADFSGGYFYPLTNADTYSDDLSKPAISDGVAGVIAGTLDADQASDVLNRLLLNASGGSSHTYVDITYQAVVANLPSDVIKILPWQSVTNGPTGGMPQDFWQKIGAVASLVVNSLVYVGQLVYKGLIALGSFLLDLVQAIADWGMKALGAVYSVVVAVAKKIADAAAALFSWVQQLALRVFGLIIDGFKALISTLLRGIADAITAALRNGAAIGSVLLGLPFVVGAMLNLKKQIELLMGALEVAEAGITTVLALLTGGIAALVKTVTATLTKEALVKAFLTAVLYATIAQIGIAVVQTFDESAFNSMFGTLFKSTASAVVIGGVLYELFKDWGKAGSVITKFLESAAGSLVALLAEVFSGDLTQMVLNALGTSDPFVHGTVLLMIDASAFLAAFFSCVKFFKKLAGEDAVKGFRNVVLTIMSPTEEAISFLGFVAVSAQITEHVVHNEYGFPY